MKRLIRITSGDDFLPPCRLPQPPEEERLWRGSQGHLSWWDDEGGAQGRQVERRQEAWLAGCERILGAWRLQLLPCVRVSACIRDSHILAGTSDPSRFLMFIRVVLFHSSCILFFFFFWMSVSRKGARHGLWHQVPSFPPHTLHPRGRSPPGRRSGLWNGLAARLSHGLSGLFSFIPSHFVTFPLPGQSPRSIPSRVVELISSAVFTEFYRGLLKRKNIRDLVKYRRKAVEQKRGDITFRTVPA